MTISNYANNIAT